MKFLTIEDLYASAWDNAIEQTAEYINKFGFNYTYEDWRVLEPFAIVNDLAFDENGFLVDNTVEGCDNITASTQYDPENSGVESYQAQCEAKKNNVLCIPDSKGRVKKYRFIRIDGQGDEYVPYDHDEWWTSYIVTPDNELLSWEFNGRYTPVDAVYGEDFWVQEDDEDEDEDYFGEVARNEYGPEIDKAYHGQVITNRLDGVGDRYESINLRAVQEKLGIPPSTTVKALEGMYYNDEANKLNDSEYFIGSYEEFQRKRKYLQGE